MPDTTDAPEMTAGWAVEEESDDHFSTLVGPLLSRADGAAKRYAFMPVDKHLNRNRVVHGGMLGWFADKSVSMTAWEAAGRPAVFATIQLDVQFIGAAREGGLVESHCEVSRRTGSMVFATGRFTSGSEVVATASGIWKYRQEK